ncbi:hypothetical protein [Actinospica robiniae]|uniref:hypothetical protein n=1 Tax=Actinospica robiniae TaxID=304901 RepID=UPI0004113AB7|nr:hypothetical protein [Actinospica robiniae]
MEFDESRAEGGELPETPGTEAARPWASPSASATAGIRASADPSGLAAPAAGAAASTDRASLRPARRREFRQRPIPLRPMTVLELIDGAVAAVPSVPRFLLVRAGLVVSGFGALAFALTWWVNRVVASAVRAHPMWSTVDFDGQNEFHLAPSGSEKFCLTTTEILIAVVCSGFAATIVAGLFAPSVKAYVDAEPADASALRALLRGRVARLWTLALITSLPRIALVAALALLSRATAVHPGMAAGGWLAMIAIFLGVPCFLVTATTAVAAPASTLEGVGVRAALRRSRRLARQGVVRAGWTCLLALFIVALATAALDFCGRELRETYGVGGQFAGLPGSPGFSWWLLLYALIYLVTLLLTTPYRSATAVLLYVDRRFRREGLDIRIAWARLAQNAPRRTGGGPNT